MTVELAFSEVKTMKTNGAIQRTAIDDERDPKRHQQRIDAVGAGRPERVGERAHRVASWRAVDHLR